MEEQLKQNDASPAEKLTLSLDFEAPEVQHRQPQLQGERLSFHMVTNKPVWGWDSYQPYEDPGRKRSIKHQLSQSIWGKKAMKMLLFIINDFPACFY